MSRTRLFFLICAIGSVVLVVALALVGPIPQDPAYHRFADERRFLGIPNFGNVASNLPFLVVGIAGTWLVARRSVLLDTRERWAWVLVFGAVALVAFGSGYYHWDPTTPRLVWDRLPMTLVFTTFTAIQLMERIGTRAGARLLPLFLTAGIASVLYWQSTESLGRGDLRPYAVVQYLPILAIPLMLALFPARYTRTRDLAEVFACYIAAKVFEALDAPILHALGGTMSGHTLKHLAAASATACLLVMVVKRRPLGAADRD